MKQEIQLEDLDPTSRSYATYLINTMKAEKHVVPTDLFTWYVTHGIRCTHVHTLLQFTPEKPFQKWMDELVEGCRSAAMVGDVLKDVTCKLQANSSFGGFLLNKSKLCNIRFTEHYERFLNRPDFRSIQSAGPREKQEQFFEVCMRKSHVVEDLPIQFSALVLGMSKFYLISTYYDIFQKWFGVENFTLLAADTDSHIIGCSGKTLRDSAKPEYLHEYDRDCKKYFVPTEGSRKTWLSREPLLLKSKAVADFGISLSPKSYFLLSLTGSYKAACKGVARLSQNTHLLTLQAYFDMLIQRITHQQTELKKVSREDIVHRVLCMYFSYVHHVLAW